MKVDLLLERLFDALVSGERPAARAIVHEAAHAGLSPERIVTELFWPAYNRIEQFHREDKLDTLAHHLATRLLRVLADQAAHAFERRPAVGRTVFAVCGPTDADELAAQMAVDLLERDGFTVQFAGGGIANDEILGRVQEQQPDVLLLFASAPSDLPNIRALIDTMRDIGACRQVQVVVGGGVFNRAEGLAAEIGADLWAQGPAELARVMLGAPGQRAASDQQTVGRKRRVRAQAA